MNFKKAAIAAALLTVSSAGWAQMAARHSHAVTLLAEGNILITGGVTDSGNSVTNNVQMYDMASNLFLAWSGNLVTARSSHTATLMSDGRVLVAGGFDASGTPLSSMEICDPKARTCANTTAMVSARGGHTATTLTKGPRAGQVLLCGGQSGAAQTSITGACETFKPSDATVSPAGAIVSPRVGHAAVALKSGKIFVTGGRRRNAGNTAWIYEAMNEMYDPELDVWSPVSALLQGRVNHTATVLSNGLIVVAAGYNGLDILSCRPGSTFADECWYIDGVLAGDTGIINQNAGSKGYLGGIEVFDPRGARAVLAEETFGTAPYRVHRHSAALLPDGVWNMYGGYGNIMPTAFDDSPDLTAASVFYLTKTGYRTANINPTSIVTFPLSVELSREVSGRLVDSDAFFSGPPPGLPSVSIESTDITLRRSTAVLDSFPVGTLIGDWAEPGSFANTVTLQNPMGTAIFDEASIFSGGADYMTDAITSTFTIPTLYPGDADKLLTGDLTTELTIELPDVYRGIKAHAVLESGAITDNTSLYTITLEKAGSSDFEVYAPVSCDSDEKTCLFVTTAAFTGLRGKISNMTPLEEGTTIYSPLETAGDSVSMNLTLYYTADVIMVLDREPTYSFTTSTVIVREMVFSTQLGYKPSEGVWKDLSDVDISPTLSVPVFDHASMITPAADYITLGGRNCESNPTAFCVRGAGKTFVPTSVHQGFTPVFESDSSGTKSWPSAPMLKSKRAYHTSTLLNDGSILTCGGSDGAKQLSSCELMSPQSREWSVTSSMTTPRTLHTATLLPDGTVMVTGGVTPSSAAVNTTEIFYPDTNRWVAAAPMASPRQNHAATLLPDGNLLITGGATVSTYSATSELYISSRAYWLPAGNLVTARAQHTATLLKNGNVLLAGGVNGFGAVPETETYSYSARTFAAGPALNTARYSHTATLLKDGNVLLTGGTNGYMALRSFELYNGVAWSYPLDAAGAPVTLSLNRSSHRAVLLPSGKVLYTGGESAGVAQATAENFNPDFRGVAPQGGIAPRAHHTSVLTSDNLVLNIGGWDGVKYLDTVDYSYAGPYPDMYGLEAETRRQMTVSTATQYFDRGDKFTLLSDATNFHGITEASGGGAGPANSSFHNPRIYAHQIDNPSGFMIDLSTRIYTWYSGVNSSWDRTLSSMTLIAPIETGELPHGWYHLRVAGVGQFSEGIPIQVTMPRPAGAPSAPVGSIMGTSSVTWTWNSGTVPAADRYALYSSSDGVFITTATFLPVVSHVQTGLQPNSEISVKVNAVNGGGGGQFAQSATYYTLAAAPSALSVLEANFTTADLSWSSSDNSPITPFEVSMCADSNFANPLYISTPVPFSDNFTSTSTRIVSMSPNRMYYFRVRARNGSGLPSDFSNVTSTITVGSVNNFGGTAISSYAINWAWSASAGADYYDLYDFSDEETKVFIGSTTGTEFIQSGLTPNTPHTVATRAVKLNPGYGPVNGPFCADDTVYTLAVAPSAHPTDPFIDITTGSFTMNWTNNGNSTWTVYSVTISTSSDFGSSGLAGTTTVSGQTVSFPGLSANMAYYARIAAVNGDDRSSAYLTMGPKYTLARPPVNVAPSGISMSGVTVNWDTNDNSEDTAYELRGTTSSFSDTYTTYVPFSRLFTDNTYTLTGLLTSTTYYFDVAARNGEGLLSSRVQAVPAAFTVAGPNGAPSGSIGGVAEADEDTVISGILPNMRAVSLSVPAGAFASPTSIAISSSITSACGGYTVCGRTMEVAVFSENGAQPQVPVTLELSYECTIPDTSKLMIARYNPVSGQCLPLETKIDPGTRKITATLNHFSVFQLMVRNASTALNDVLIYPNPFRANRGNGFVTMANMPASAKVRIYTLSGTKVWEGTAGTTGILIWRGVNKAGQQVASGIYLAVVDSSAGKKVFKVAVER